MNGLSVVVPTLNAASTLARCLETLACGDELIVVDGGSADETVAVAQGAGARVIVAERGRGSQLRAGAAAATGDWLLFVHADTLLEPGWRGAVEDHMRVDAGNAGYFRLRLQSDEWPARLIERAVAIRSRLFGLPYGDQGLLLPRSLYDEVGGFAPMPLMEDVDIVRRIGASRLRPIHASASTSARRWQKDGWIGRSARNLVCLLLYRLGTSPERLSRIYG
jgi:rSAM/selenodomain-associated transferase 2